MSKFNVLFVCHGNICRSPMAHMILHDMIEKDGLNDRVFVSSRATHTDEIGEPVYYETVRVLKQNNVPILPHKATQIKVSDCDEYDLIVCMDDENMSSLKRIFGTKFNKNVKFLLEFADENLNNKSVLHSGLIVKDPYYTRDFEKCYTDIFRGCAGLMEYIKCKIC